MTISDSRKISSCIHLCAWSSIITAAVGTRGAVRLSSLPSRTFPYTGSLWYFEKHQKWQDSHFQTAMHIHIHIHKQRTHRMSLDAWYPVWWAVSLSSFTRCTRLDSSEHAGIWQPVKWSPVITSPRTCCSGSLKRRQTNKHINKQTHKHTKCLEPNVYHVTEGRPFT